MQSGSSGDKSVVKGSIIPPVNHLIGRAGKLKQALSHKNKSALLEIF